MFQYGNDIIPVDAKSGNSITSKSLTAYTKTFNPKFRLRYSMRNLILDGTLLNIPLFLADRTHALLSRAYN